MSSVWKYVLIGAGGLGLCGVLAVGITVFIVTRDLPGYEVLAHYEPPVTTRVYAGNGTLIGEYARERRLFVPIEQIRTRYFIRVTCQDKPGVFARIAAALGENDVSIASVIQKEPENGAVPVVILTHQTQEKNFRAALERIDAEPFTAEPSAFIRVEADE